MRNIKNKRMVKLLIGALIFIAILMATNGVKARQLSPYTALTGGETWGGYPMYCLENGQHFAVNDNYEEKVTGNLDLYLGYIAKNYSSNNPRDGVFGINDKGQNLIWRYIDSNETTRNELNIHLNNARGYGLRPGGYNSGLIAEDWNNVTNYVNRINNAQVYINNLKLDGSNISFEYGGNADSYTIRANGTEVTPTTINGKSTISVKDVNAIDGKITIEVVGKWTIYTGQYKLLVNTTNKPNRQALIVLIPSSYEITKSASATIQANIEVSMQKYITKVNGKDITETENKTSLIDRKNTYPNPEINDKEVAKNETMQKPKQNKDVNVVAIEAGDYVTYRIHVYNNSAYTSSKITIEDKLPEGVTKYSINGSAFKDINSGTTFKHEISNLIGGASTYFEVTVYFGTYTESDADNPLTNNAKISSTTPPNKTNYRTEDEDYVYMKKYAVSLEKYISGINSPNNNDDIDENIRKEYMDKYGEIIKYLNNHKTQNIDTLIQNLNGKNIDNIKDYDLNGDGKVDTKDVEIYKASKYFSTENYSNIFYYIQHDLNKDGKVDKDDETIYKLDINGDGRTNKFDYAAYILYKNLFKNNDASKAKEVLEGLKIYNSYINKYGITSDYVLNNILDYIKRDVNDDGFNDEFDNCNISFNPYDDSQMIVYYRNNSYLLNMAEDYFKNITDEETNSNRNIIVSLSNSNYSDSSKISIYDIDKIIKLFDVNNNGRIDDDDIKLFTDYINVKSKIDAIAELKIEEKENYQEKLAECVYGDDTTSFNDFLSLDPSYDLDDKQGFTYEDWTLYLSYSNYINNHNKNENAFNINNVNVKTLGENLNYLKSKYDIIKNDNNVEGLGLGEEDLAFIKVYKGYKEYKELTEEEKQNIIKYCDLNNDGVINNNDLEIIKRYRENETIITSILGDSWLYTLNIDNDMLINYLDTIIKNDYYISTIESNIWLNIGNIDIPADNKKITDNLIFFDGDYDVSLWSDYYYNEYIKPGRGETEEKLIGLYDVSKDGKVTEEDIRIISNEYVIIDQSKIVSINEYKKNDPEQELLKNKILANDLNKDGIWDENDSKLKEQVDQIKTNENEKNLITKIVKTNVATSSERANKAEYGTSPIYPSDTKTSNTEKYNNPVEVKNGNNVTYTIKVKNDGETGVYITEITDYLPDGVKYADTSYTGDTYCTGFNSQQKTTYGKDGKPILSDYAGKTNNAVTFTNTAGIYLKPGETTSFTVTVQVIEPNMSVNVLRNIAVISKMENKNQVNVKDSTPDDNTDSDYIQLKGVDDGDTSAYIKGTVWNDIAQDKTQNYYNGILDDNDKRLAGITVKLYRENKGYIAETQTSENGEYIFTDESLNKNTKLNKNERFIKGPKSPDTGRWTGEYYTYYVEFEYDGITYTSACNKDGLQLGCEVNSEKDAPTQNNAFENETERKEFNNKFSTINNKSDIAYTTTNESGYAPQSNHVYNPKNMAMHSSTNLINMGDYGTENNLSDTPLSHVNLGLRGRDIFDLELTTDVYSVKVGVNGQSNTYMYNNKVTLRNSDLNPKEDMANKDKEGNITYSDTQTQGVRESDVINGNSLTDLAITVTYKITVQNTSNTPGTATKITNYFDSYYYQEPKVYSDAEKTNALAYTNGDSGDRFNSIVITTQNTLLNQSETMDIYVEYTIRPNAAYTLSGITNAAIPTYNMSEITEYRTQCGDNQTEYTRGLIDKDSAPGSANTEDVRLAPNETGNLTTVQYYFAGNNLDKLKYEDDTYATPVLYFSTVSDEYKRTINGTVFEDYTTILEEDNNRIKTGNGIKDDAEPGIYGVTVELYEVGNDTAKQTTTTDANGNFTFKDFLPGNYYIRYHYGNTDDTFLVNTENTESYNGEDFESTNNTGRYGARKLNTNNAPYWYIDNEGDGVSTATDNSDRRETVSDYASKLNDEYLIFLNSVRDGLKANDIKEGSNEKTIKDNIKENTKMFADTPHMLFTLEKCDNKGNQPTTFGKYEINNMNFGISEVPVTKIDLQKNVYSFRITDVTGTNTIAQLHIDKDNTIVKINPSKISKKRQAIVKKVLVDNLGVDGAYIQGIMDNEDYKKEGSSIPVNDGTFKYSDIKKLKEAITQSSLAREVQIVYAWKVDKGDILAPAGTASLDVSIENEKLQGAKLEITYELSASMYTEVDFNNINTRLTPSITGLTDYVDNNLTYNKDSAVKIEDKEYKNEDYWTVSEKTNVEDPNKVKHTTVVEAKTGNELLLQKVGEGKAYITLEKVLSSTDSTLEQIIKSTVDSYEYNNIIEITAIDYKNTTTEETGNHEYKDRIQTTDRFTILPPTKSNDGDKIITPGSHNWTSSQEIAIHPPTGENKGITYLILGIASLVILAGGVFVIKKFVLKK